jgi:hypothetical protein
MLEEWGTIAVDDMRLSPRTENAVVMEKRYIISVPSKLL